MSDERPPEREPKPPRDRRKVDPETGEPRTKTPQVASDEVLSDADIAMLLEPDRQVVLQALEREAEFRERAARAEAELKNFRTRVERDRAANREAVIAEVIRQLLPAIDDLDRADAHGDLVEGEPLTLVAQKLRAGFGKFGLRRIGEIGEPFDPSFHEAIVQIPTPGATTQTVADVITPGYALFDRLIRAAKVAVSVPES